jgi:glutamate/tyrosine decarboxylase-like PLP-dependent enzyme
VKTYRDLARAERPWISRPEIVVPETAHVAWDKGGEYFGVKVVHAPLTKDHWVDVRAVRKLVGRRTVMILGSAPDYPHGVVDPVEDLGALAVEKRIPLHVDACLGGYLLPFAERLGYPVPRFDFRVPGVTSISADTHKYGYSAKGASVLLYRSARYLRHQLFVCENWPGGVFASPGILGTRPGGSIAAAWAAMQAMGMEGFLRNTKVVMETTRRLTDGIAAIPELYVVGRPQMCVFAYGSREPEIGVYAVADQMEEKGWLVDRLQRPEAIHATVTPFHEGVVEEYLRDLREAVETVRRNPELSLKGGAATYGMVAHIPLRGMVRETVLRMMLESYGAEAKGLDAAAGAAREDFATRAAISFLKLRNALARLRRRPRKP